MATANDKTQQSNCNESIEKYLENMQFKKRVFGGLDEEDVLLHIKSVCDLYNQELIKLQKMKNDDSKAKSKIEALEKDLSQQKVAYVELKTKLEKAEKQCEELRKNQSTNSMIEVERLKREYEQKNNELCIAIETLQNAKNEITVQSQVEAVKETAKLKNELMTKIQKERIIAQKEVERLRSEAENLQKQNELAQQKFKQNTAQMQQLIDQMINELQSMRDGTVSTVKKFPSAQYDMCVGK